MRIVLIISGILVVVISALFLPLALTDSVYFETVLFGFALGALNLVLGLATRKAGGVKVSANLAEPVRMSVDKGVIGPTVYYMAFSSKKLVLKKLTSGNLTILTVVLLAVLGFLIAAIVGAAEGGLTAFSIQEFVTQRRRNQVEAGNVLDASNAGDIEFQYSNLEKVELTRNRLRLYVNDKILRIVISRKYPDKMRETLTKIVGSSK